MMDLGREEILRRFTGLLDRALSSEEPPSGIDSELLAAATAGSEEEDGHDSYALWAAMTTLAQEVKLQSRSFKELSDAVGAQPAGTAEEIRAAFEQVREREREVQRATEYRCRKDALGVLMDLRDRMARGLEAVRGGEAEIARSSKAGWFARWFAPRNDPTPAMLSALTKGYELSIERLDQALGEWNAHEIRCQGEIFDPKRMNAIDREESREVPEGTVLEVYRSGYEWNGELFRPAQVKVACAPDRGESK
ncbi:MAG TPA: nucleotide exchange factor GrpE [Candidatus Solibacter sp.]|nr:nucleotide exchange factor GrpE [Candidatus Solibacter sp.]